MRRVGLMVLAIAALAGCGGSKTLITPQSRLIYNDGKQSIWTTCDKGNRLYMTPDGIASIVPGGCQDGNP